MFAPRPESHRWQQTRFAAFPEVTGARYPLSGTVCPRLRSKELGIVCHLFLPVTMALQELRDSRERVQLPWPHSFSVKLG